MDDITAVMLYVQHFSDFLKGYEYSNLMVKQSKRLLCLEVFEINS